MEKKGRMLNNTSRRPSKKTAPSAKGLPLQSPPMFAARPFTLLNTAPAALAGGAARATTTKTTTIKG
ncbi:hypothetical protein AVKW3434_18550 [Acidovorax sp. SUPP3434]|uniref:hypothetical protein n=1 Tax=Acidovorax sp. SUPP3434 TaxID=2920880 RepID=UPI0023DE39B8|nr:hypothetical protein [Acidovorax sp. SUPP3434]GKT01421.1 hypothetical protein AVKW3434_18550 [Acidovorax sp. SUPP3434]